MHTDPARDELAAGKRTRLAWYAYDLGNTSVEFAIPLYVTLWIVTDLGVPAWVFGLATAASSWAIGLSGPYIGVSADEKQTRRQWFTVSAVVAAVLLASLAFLPRTGHLGAALILVGAMAANYFFQLSSLIYNASMLSAARGANVVSVSSFGMGLSFLGGAIGVGIIHLVTSGSLIPGVSGRRYALVPAALLFLACTIPSIFAPGLWQRRSETAPPAAERLLRRMKEVWREASHKHLAGWFLAGYFALNSAIQGLTLYLPLHFQTVTDLHGTNLLLVFGTVVITSAAGAGVVAFLQPSGPTVRRIILLGLTLLALNAFVFSLVSSLPLMVLCACLHGLFSGALTPTVRGAFAQTFHSEYQALAFGLFGAVQRVSQGLGALLWPLVGAGAGSRGTRVGIAAMGVVALIGAPFFARWRLGASPSAGAVAGAAESEDTAAAAAQDPTEEPR